MGTPAPFELINEIRVNLQNAETQSHYERLGVDEKAGTSEIRRAYMKLAAKWHPDKFSQYDLGGTEADLQRLFALLTDSHGVLTNDKKREAYDISLEWESSESTGPDVMAMMGADNTFRLGQQLLERGQMKAAYAQFEQAVKANKDSHEYAAYHAYTAFSQLKKRSDGIPVDREQAAKYVGEVKAALDAMEEFEMGHVFLGHMLLAMGEKRAAIRQYKSAVYLNPKNVQAQRQLRLLAMRSDKGSFFDKIADFFRKK